MGNMFSFSKVHRKTKYWMDPMGTSGVGVENFPGHTILHILREIQKLMGEWDCAPEEFLGRIIYVDVQRHHLGKKKGNELSCVEN